MAIDLGSQVTCPPKPPRMLLHGREGVGKTTFACGAPNAYLLDLEGGRGLCAPKMAQEPKTYADVLDHIRALIEQDHGYQTLIVDSLDVLESLITDQVCLAGGYSSISSPAYGKGYAERTRIWSTFWTALDCLRDRRGMMIILIAHSQVVKVEDPILPAFDAHELHLYKTEKAKATEWPDMVGFCMVKTYTVQDGERNLATTADERVLLTKSNPAYTAKNRYSMPEEIPLSWQEFEKHLGLKPNGDE
ncbi:MAG: ATP-binding protein [Smithellaceae bacterium]|nr:ATP-binding protein [Candidatus Omnitrophota bacterium]